MKITVCFGPKHCIFRLKTLYDSNKFTVSFGRKHCMNLPESLYVLDEFSKGFYTENFVKGRIGLFGGESVYSLLRFYALCLLNYFRQNVAHACFILVKFVYISIFQPQLSFAYVATVLAN